MISRRDSIALMGLWALGCSTNRTMQQSQKASCDAFAGPDPKPLAKAQAEQVLKAVLIKANKQKKICNKFLDELYKQEGFRISFDSGSAITLEIDYNRSRRIEILAIIAGALNNGARSLFKELPNQAQAQYQAINTLVKWTAIIYQTLDNAEPENIIWRNGELLNTRLREILEGKKTIEEFCKERSLRQKDFKLSTPYHQHSITSIDQFPNVKNLLMPHSQRLDLMTPVVDIHNGSYPFAGLPPKNFIVVNAKHLNSLSSTENQAKRNMICENEMLHKAIEKLIGPVLRYPQAPFIFTEEIDGFRFISNAQAEQFLSDVVNVMTDPEEILRVAKCKYNTLMQASGPQNNISYSSYKYAEKVLDDFYYKTGVKVPIDKIRSKRDLRLFFRGIAQRRHRRNIYKEFQEFCKSKFWSTGRSVVARIFDKLDQLQAYERRLQDKYKLDQAVSKLGQ